MKLIDDLGMEYEIVDSIPQGYSILNIPYDTVKGYLPLHKPNGTYSVDIETLKVVRCDETKDIIYSAGWGHRTVKKMNWYINKYSKSTNPVIQRRIKRIKKAIEVLSTVDGYENLI